MEWLAEWLSEILPGIVAAWAVGEHLLRLYSEAMRRQAEAEVRRLRKQIGPWSPG